LWSWTTGSYWSPGPGREWAPDSPDAASVGAAVVIVNDFVPERAAAVAAEVGELGRRVRTAFRRDQLRAVGEAFETVKENFGHLHALVNNAGNAGAGGTAALSDFWQDSPSDWDRWLGTNLFGVLNCVRHESRSCVSTVRALVTIISDAGPRRRGGPRGLLECQGRSRGVSCGPSRAAADGNGITANCVSISATRTRSSRICSTTRRPRNSSLKRYIIRRFGNPRTFRVLSRSLCSDAGAWITSDHSGQWRLSLAL